MSKPDNFVILDKENIILIQKKSDKRILNYKHSNEVESSLFEKKKVVLLLSAKQTYIKNFILSKKVRNKLDELIKTKFIYRLSVSAKELYYSYFVDEFKKDKLNVLCFAVKKSVLDEKYDLLSNMGVKIEAIFPIPLLYFLKYRTEKKFKKVKASQLKKEDKAYIYINELANSLYFTVFYSDGIYLHSCKSTNYIKELIKIKEYLNNHLNIYEIMVCNNEKSFELSKMITDEDKYKKNIAVEINLDVLFSKIDKKEIKQINMLKLLSVEKKKQEKKYRRTIGFIIFLIVAINSLSIYNYVQYKYELLEINREQLIKLQPTIENLNLLQKEIDIVNDQLKTYKNIVKNRQTYLPWIYELNKRLPLDAKVNNLIFKDNAMVLLEGSASSASKTMELLQESELFSNLEFIGGIAIEDGRERFQIAGDLANE